MYVSIYQSIYSIYLYFYLYMCGRNRPYTPTKASNHLIATFQWGVPRVPWFVSWLLCLLDGWFAGKSVGLSNFFITGWKLHFHAPIWAHLFCYELATLQLQRRWIENVGSTFCLDISRWSSNDFGTSCRNDFINRLIGSWYFYPNVSGSIIL